MKGKYIISIAIWVFILLVFGLSEVLPVRALDLAVIAVSTAVLAGFGVYRIVLWLRYWNDPTKRDSAVLALYPGWWRRFALDENDEKKSKRGPILSGRC